VYGKLDGGDIDPHTCYQPYLTNFNKITWGPLSYLTALLIVKDSPYRHPIQALVSTGQFYGDLLYYMTSLFDDFYAGRKFYRPEPYYFWFYFIFMNTWWIVIPLRKCLKIIRKPTDAATVCLFSSIKASAKAFATSQKLEATKTKSS
jgi:cholestenol delta-isomerase